MRSAGLTVEVFDKDQLIEMGCGGLLGVNAGSVEPPRMIKLAYRPEGEATGHLAFVGKGIMYDSVASPSSRPTRSMPSRPDDPVRADHPRGVDRALLRVGSRSARTRPSSSDDDRSQQPRA